MIGKQVKGTSFRGVLNYLAAKEEAQLIGGNMVGKTPRFLAAEFKVALELNPKLKKAVYHASLSLPKTERLDNESWRAIASDYIKGMGFEGSQYVVYRHTDKQHDHIHIVASRIRLSDGTTVSDSWDYRRSETLIRDLEQKYQLTVAPSSDQKLERGQTTGEKRQTERTGEKSIRLQLQEILDRATEEPITMPQLIERLKNWGVDARVSFTREEKIKGISYSLSGIAISGTHLGKAYTFPGLQKHRGVIYEPSQEPEIRAASVLKPQPQSIVLEKGSSGIDRTNELTHQVEENQQQEQKPPSASPLLSKNPSSDESEPPNDLEGERKKENPSLQEQQQWVLSNYLTLLKAIGDDRRWRANRGLSSHPDECETIRGKYRLTYHAPTQTFTIDSDDGRGEILKTRIVDESEEFWRTSLTRADLDFLSELENPHRPVVGTISHEDARILYQQYKGNEAYGYATQWAQADTVAVKNALDSGLTSEQAVRIIAKSPRAIAIREKYGSEQALEYIVERINSATGKPFAPIETAQTAQRLYDSYLDGMSGLSAVGSDNYIARCAINDGWKTQSIEAILAQSPHIQKLSHLPGSGAKNYVESLVNHAQSWYQRERLVIPEPDLAISESQPLLSSQQQQLAIEVYRVSMQMFKELALNQSLCVTPEGVWYFQGHKYTLEYDPDSRRFSLEHQERGEILKVNLGGKSVIEMASVRPTDVEPFQKVLDLFEKQRQQSREATIERSQGRSRSL